PEIESVISIFADVAFLASLLEGSTTFVEESVRYIYKKQLEEADLIVINKSDLITPDQEKMIRTVLSEEYSGKPHLLQNSMAESDVVNRVTRMRSEGHTSELQSRENHVCRLLLEKETPDTLRT